MDPHAGSTDPVVIPEEVRDAISELSSAQRWAVFLAIHRNDRNFNELRRELEISAQQLDNVLRGLVTGGLVFREITSPAAAGDRARTRYTIAPLGKELVWSLHRGFTPHPEPVPSGYLSSRKTDVSGMVVSETGISHGTRQQPVGMQAGQPASPPIPPALHRPRRKGRVSVRE